ncbi:asparagine synthase-related protein [Gammaproteobacteria bacterium]|nr:asparagine synthase-related protein [Gammaproteobacteria bacterium]
MTKSKSIYGLKGTYGPTTDLDKILNKEVVAKYLYTGAYARPGSRHFLKGYQYQDIERFSINRNLRPTLDDVLDAIRLNVKKILTKHNRISLFMTSGLDSYLIYLVMKRETDNFKTHHDISLVTGRFTSPYDEFSVLKDKSPDIEIHPYCDTIDTPDEALKYLKLAIRANNQPVNGLVAAAVFKAFSIADKLKSAAVLGTGETIFFNSNFDFIKTVNSSEIRGYASDKTILKSSDYLTEFGLQLANKGISETTQNYVFDPIGDMEEFIHTQQFWIDAPRVDFENSSYSRHLGVDALTPFRDENLVNIFFNLPKEIQHDGRSKTVTRLLIEQLDGREYEDGLKMTSPQREYLRLPYKDGGFSELVEYFIEHSSLVELGIVDKAKFQNAYDSYVLAFDEAKRDGSFKELSSYNIWKFFITELWLNEQKGNDTTFDLLGVNT